MVRKRIVTSFQTEFNCNDGNVSSNNINLTPTDTYNKNSNEMCNGNTKIDTVSPRSKYIL